MSSLILGIPNYEKININQKLTYSPSLETSKVKMVESFKAFALEESFPPSSPL